MSDGPTSQHTLHGRVLTGAGWLEGDFHIGTSGGFAAYLSNHEWYPMTQVVMAKVGTMPFFELARREALLIAPDAPPPAPAAGHRAVAATLLFPGGAVDATCELAPGQRLSDLVSRTAGFLLVRNANVRVWADERAHFHEHLLVNLARLVGVTEPPEAPT